MTLQILIAAVLAALVAGFGGGIYTHRKLDDAAAYRAQKQADMKSRADTDKVWQAAASFTRNQVQAEARETIVTKEVIRVVSQPVYREQCFDADGLRILSDDASASNARRGLEPALPASATTR